MRRLALIFALLLSGRAAAYVTSATLEFAADDGVAFYLNGKVLLAQDDQRGKWHAFSYDTLSSSDGSLPVGQFNMNGDNQLAADNYDLGGGSIMLSYRLTVHHSSGDPIRVWSEPGNTRFLALARNVAPPAGWMDPGFDDSKWEFAREARIANPDGFLSPELLDPFFGGLFGSGSYVPFVSHRSDAQTPVAGVHNLYRSHFRFPNQAAKPLLKANTLEGTRGQKIALRVLPGPDSADLGPFHVMAPVPAGMRLIQASPGATWDKAHNQVLWSFPDASKNSGIVTLHLDSIIKSSGWDRPDKALGAWKKEKDGPQGNITDLVRNDAAYFFPGDGGWFKASAPQIPAGAEDAVILGVLFRFQLNTAATSDPIRRKTDQFVFNYSIDGSERGALKKNAVMDSCTRWGWHNGYYDASEDRKWSWNDLKALKILIDAEARLEGDKNGIASCEVYARYYQPAKTAPTYYLQVDEAACKGIPVEALVYNKPNGYVKSEPLRFVANPGLCPKPKPVYVAPQPTPLPGNTPLPTPTPQPLVDTGLAFTVPPLKLGCLESAPEPFKRGGVFVFYCVQAPSTLTLNVYDQAGKTMRSMAAGEVNAGKGQIFYNGMNDHGEQLKPGAYAYEIVAKAEGRKELMHATFNKVKDAR